MTSGRFCDQSALRIVCLRSTVVLVSTFLLAVGSQLFAQDAVHFADAYVPGESLEVTASFSHDGVNELQGLAWFLDLPAGWTASSVSGDGDPELADNGTDLLFTAGVLPNPLHFTITLDVPVTSSGAQNLSAVAEYFLTGMVNPADLAVMPDPLVVEESPVSVWPEAMPIVYGQSLADVILTNETTTTDGTFSFDDASVTPAAGTHPFMLTFTPDDVTNYVIVSNTIHVVVTQKPLHLVGVEAQERIYNGLVGAVIADYGVVDGVLPSDEVFVGIVVGETQGYFEDRHVGDDKLVTVDPFFLYGEDAANYSMGPQTTTASITPKTLTISGSFEAQDKDWDDTVAAVIDVNALELMGVEVVDAPEVALVPTAEFESSYPGVQTVRLVAASDLTGNFASNYSLSVADAPTTTATINNVFSPLGVPVTFYLDAGIEPEPGDDWDDVDYYDSDGDGMLNWEEYVAGTDPSDPASRLVITKLSTVLFRVDDEMYRVPYLEWMGGTLGPSVPYIVESTPSLSDPDWRVETHEEPRKELNVWTGTDVVQSNRFYRIRATSE